MYRIVAYQIEPYHCKSLVDQTARDFDSAHAVVQKALESSSKVKIEVYRAETSRYWGQSVVRRTRNRKPIWRHVDTYRN